MTVAISQPVARGLVAGGLIGMPLGFVLLLVDQAKNTDGSFGYGIAAIICSTAALVTAAVGRRDRTR